MAALDWQGWLTIGVVLATLGLLLWERFTPDKILIGAVVVLIASGNAQGHRQPTGHRGRRLVRLAASWTVKEVQAIGGRLEKPDQQPGGESGQ